ncbi:copper homeostasis protein CutC [Asticcacaulis sp. AC402]|uniref:copper homeostasis protein CutC n=1 Tax=Asticcacaulis sp. AC402 TaxID=1282361 RepID=UPI0003C40044|nr:copper homeostasis protein CutC [Asticcacaulis sp. AC402]ESQ74987.1 hypothetical protein ABAC402_11325 [Asticcacaulis sp. AC402]
MSDYLLEVCVDTAAGVRAAAMSGADRIELCAALAVGGLTPSSGLMRLALETGLDTRIMVRPRAGDFIYSADELDVMRHDIEAAASIGLAGVVFGANHADGRLDIEVLDRLMHQARRYGLETALHRSFDLAPDLSQALETTIALGFDTVLTSGGARSAPAGVDRLRDLVEQADGRIEILAGAGVTAANAGAILMSGVKALHASCSSQVPLRSPRAVDLGYVAPEQRDTDPGLVAALRAALDTHEAKPREDSHVVC